MNDESFDLTDARRAILAEFRADARTYGGFALGSLAVAVALLVAYLVRLAPDAGPVWIFLAILLAFLAATFLFAAQGLSRNAPSRLIIDSAGLSFVSPRGRTRTVSWSGRPRPYESEPVICDIWQRPPPGPSDAPARAYATIALCPPYPLKTRFYPSVGLSAEALGGILRAAESRGLRVATQSVGPSRVSGFSRRCPAGTVHYTIYPRPSPP